MFTTTVSRDDLTVEEVAAALRRGLGSGYTAEPGTAVNFAPGARPRAEHPDEIVVGRGSNRVLRVGVRLSHHSGETALQVRAGRLTLVGWLVERVLVGRPVLRVLRSELGGR